MDRVWSGGGCISACNDLLGSTVSVSGSATTWLGWLVSTASVCVRHTARLPVLLQKVGATGRPMCGVELSVGADS